MDVYEDLKRSQVKPLFWSGGGRGMCQRIKNRHTEDLLILYVS